MAERFCNTSDPVEATDHCCVPPLERFQCRGAGPQLLLQAFLQRIVNGGGRIERECGLGRRRIDLLIVWPPGRFAGGSEAAQPPRRYVVECEIVLTGSRRPGTRLHG